MADDNELAPRRFTEYQVIASNLAALAEQIKEMRQEQKEMRLALQQMQTDVDRLQAERGKDLYRSIIVGTVMIAITLLMNLFVIAWVLGR